MQRKSISSKLVMLHRIGQPDLPKDVFHHPSLFKINDSQFDTYLKLGHKGLDLFSKEYCSARFPTLPLYYRLKSHEIYTCNHNLALIAKEFGMEHALMGYSGRPLIHPQSLPLGQNDSILSDCFKSILGAIMSIKGPKACRDFLDTFLYSSTRFDIKKFFNPKNPIVMLSKRLFQSSKSPLEFRLLHESGRMSNDSMFVVGAFSDKELLSEGYGPSLLLAQRRAALEYLYKTCLIEKTVEKRFSDSLFNNGPKCKIPPNTFPALKNETEIKDIDKNDHHDHNLKTEKDSKDTLKSHDNKNPLDHLPLSPHDDPNLFLEKLSKKFY